MKTPFTSPEYVDFGDLEGELCRLIDKLHRYHVKHDLAWPPQFLVRQIARDLSQSEIGWTTEPKPLNTADRSRPRVV